MDIKDIAHEKELVSIIFARDTLIEQLGMQANNLMKENETLQKRLDDQSEPKPQDGKKDDKK